MVSESTAARLEATRALDEFYASYKRKVGASLFGCCSIPAFTLLAIPTYILLWTEGSIWRSMALGAGAWLGGSFALLLMSMAFDHRITGTAARRFEAAFPRDTAARTLAIEVLRARMADDDSAAQSLLARLGELPTEQIQEPAPTVEAELAGALTDAPGMIIPIEDDGAAAPRSAAVTPAPPRLRYIPLEPERPPPDDESP